MSWTHLKCHRDFTWFLIHFRFWWRKVHFFRGPAMAPAVLHVLSLLRDAGGRRLLPRARWDSLSQLQQQLIERNPIHTPYLPICTHTYTCLFYTAVPSNENFTFQFTPMQILLFEITANQQSAPHTIVWASPKYSKNRLSGLRLNKQDLKDAPKIAVELWKPCTRCWGPTTVYPLHNPVSTLHKLVGLYAQIQISDLPTSYSHLFFFLASQNCH